MGPIPSGSLKNLKDVDKWPFLSLYLPLRGMSVTCELGAVPVQLDGFNRALSPAVYGEIVLSINTQYKYNDHTSLMLERLSTGCRLNITLY